MVIMKSTENLLNRLSIACLETCLSNIASYLEASWDSGVLQRSSPCKVLKIKKFSGFILLFAA